jgi:hypothetical protein
VHGFFKTKQHKEKKGGSLGLPQNVVTKIAYIRVFWSVETAFGSQKEKLVQQNKAGSFKVKVV